MGFGKVLKHVVSVGKTALPIASAFGVPGASSVQAAVTMIQGNPKQDDKEAVVMLGASVDNLDDRVDKLEAFVEGLKAGRQP